MNTMGKLLDLRPKLAFNALQDLIRASRARFYDHITSDFVDSLLTDEEIEEMAPIFSWDDERFEEEF